MIGDEIGLTGHLLPGVVDIGDRGLPTRSHGKMREVICSRSLRGSIQFPRRQGGKSGSGFEVQRQTDDGLRGGDFERSGKAAEIEQGRHILRTMPVGRQHQIFDSQHLPIRVPGSKGNQSRCVGRVGIGHSGPILAFSLLGKGDKAGGRNCRRIDSGFRHGHPFAVIPTKQKAGLHRPRAVGPRPAWRQRSAQRHVGLLVNGSPWRQNVGPAVNRSQSRKRDHQRSSVIGDEIGLAGHLLRGVVDIGDRGLPTRSHGKMGEVIDLVSRSRVLGLQGRTTCCQQKDCGKARQKVKGGAYHSP